MGPTEEPTDQDELREAVSAAEEIDGYLDEHVDPDASAEEEAAAVIDAHEGDPGFRDMVRRLSKALRLGK